MALARDLPATWNAPGTDARTKQRITHILIREVVLDRDDATNEALVTIHWNGGRHTELRVSRVRTGRYPADRHPSPVEVDPQARRPMAGSRAGRDDEPDALQTRRRQGLDDRSGARASRAARDRALSTRRYRAPRRSAPTRPRPGSGICVGSVHKLIREGVLPATQLMQSAPWQIPVAALDTEAVKTGVREIVGRRPSFTSAFKRIRRSGFPDL